MIGQLEDNPLLYPLVRDLHLGQKGYRLEPIEYYLVFYLNSGRTVEVRPFLFGARKYSSILSRPIGDFLQRPGWTLTDRSVIMKS